MSEYELPTKGQEVWTSKGTGKFTGRYVGQGNTRMIELKTHDNDEAETPITFWVNIWTYEEIKEIS